MNLVLNCYTYLKVAVIAVITVIAEEAVVIIAVVAVAHAIAGEMDNRTGVLDDHSLQEI